MNVRAFAASCLALGLFQPAAICFQNSKLRKELESSYKKWLDQDVGYIISNEERQAWTRLATDEEREQSRAAEQTQVCIGDHVPGDEVVGICFYPRLQ